jgi:phytoene dehydrogenase-like protein
LALASPFFRSINLEELRIPWIFPPVPLAHPLDQDPPVLLLRSMQDTAHGLGVDAGAYKRLIKPFLRRWNVLVPELLRPLGFSTHPFLMLRFARKALRSARAVAESRFNGLRAKALFAGTAAHAIFPLEWRSSAGFGLMLCMAGHAVGWPIVRGGSQAVSEALGRHLVSMGGIIQLGHTVSSFSELPSAAAYLFDVTPRQLATIAGSVLPETYLSRLRQHKHGPGVFKIDWALSEPIPWRDTHCLRAGTLHLGGTLEEICDAEREVWAGKHPEKPFVLVSQPSLFDPDRAPLGMHTAWGYCHVPNGSTVDMTERIEQQVERFAPGFQSTILARHVMFPVDMETYNPNYIGGDIAGGLQTFQQLFVRPLGRWSAYATPVRGIYLCSSSMPPGGGVHGMCGYLAALRALKEVLGD